MSELKKVAELVQHILKEDEKARNSDNILYLKVLEHYSERKGIDLHQMTVPVFFLQMNDYGFPVFESVSRSRRKMQETYPDLVATGVVGRRRAKKENEYREFAKNGIAETEEN